LLLIYPIAIGFQQYVTQRIVQAVRELAMGWKNRDLPCSMVLKSAYYFRYFLLFFRPSVRPSFHKCQHVFHWRDLREIWFWWLLWKYVWIFQVWLNLGT